jgi:hypothetical protein
MTVAELRAEIDRLEKQFAEQVAPPGEERAEDDD